MTKKERDLSAKRARPLRYLVDRGRLLLFGTLAGVTVASLPAQESPGPSCGAGSGFPCWHEVRPGCFMLRLFVPPNTADGECSGGFAQGKWTEQYVPGGSQEGTYVDGKRHGSWILEYTNQEAKFSSLSTGSYVDGYRHGEWTMQTSFGALHKGPYRNGLRHGQWTIRPNQQDVWRGQYVEGVQQGRWVGVLGEDERVEERIFVDGVEQ